MREPHGPAALVWLETSAPAAAMREWLWLYPGVEVVHIVGIVLLVGAVALFDLRLIGLARGPDERVFAGYLLPWAWVGLALVVPSGLLLFSAHATEMVANPAFRLKFALIAAAGANALWFHRVVRRRAPATGAAAGAPRGARLAGGISLLLWIGVIACGRLLAYL